MRRDIALSFDQNQPVETAVPLPSSATAYRAWHDASRAVDAPLPDLLPKVVALAEAIEALHEAAAGYERRLADELIDARWALHDFLQEPAFPEPDLRRRILALVLRDLTDFQRQLEFAHRANSGAQHVNRYLTPSKLPASVLLAQSLRQLHRERSTPPQPPR
jgi:hypothetical protein